MGTELEVEGEGGVECDGLTGPGQVLAKRGTALRRGREISTDNFVGSICTALLLEARICKRMG